MYTSPPAEILTIGDELTRGEIVNTNASWLAAELFVLGYHVRWQTSVTDDEADIAEALRLAARRADLIVCSGGLGPTADDRTVDVISGLLGVEPAIDDPHRAQMETRFAARGFEVTPNNLRQVRVPSGAAVLANRVGLAPGFAVALRQPGQPGQPGQPDRTVPVYVMPGVPREMKHIFAEEIAPRLRARTPAAGPGAATPMPTPTPTIVARRVWRAAGIGESHVDHRLSGLLDGIDDATLHFRIAFPENLVTVVVRRPSREEAEAVLGRLDAEVRARLGDHVYAEGEQTLAEAIGLRLRAAGTTLATAESCTGGLIADLVTDVPGSSDYFRGGLVAYSNALKQSMLGVSTETLATHGAVSEACVREMALGAQRALGADWAVAVSGIAGPGGGSAEKPVGTVHLAVAGPPAAGSPVATRKLFWPGERRMVKQLAAHTALFMLYRQVAGGTDGATPPASRATNREGGRG